MAAKTAKVRFDRIEFHDPQHDEYRFLIIDTDGDVFLNEHSDESGASLMFRKASIPALIKALRMAVS